MTATTRSNITPPPGAHQGGVPPFKAPRRDQIAAATVDTLKRGGPSKADLLVVDLGEGPMVVKDFAGKSWWARWLGRFLIGREIRAYGWLGDTPGVPRLIGRVDAHAVALEKIEGVMLFPAVKHRDDGEILLPKIRELIDRFHSRGFSHLDLNRENLMRRPDDEIVAVDLAGGIWFRPGGLGHRLLFGLFATADETAYLKWKSRLTPGELDPDEEARFRRLRFLRSLWPFNRPKPRNKG